MAVLSTIAIIIYLSLGFTTHQGETAVAKRILKKSMIVNGQQASEGQFPYAVSLQTTKSSGKCRQVCTLSLITTKTCLGAAHCARENSPEKYCGLVGIIDNSNCLQCRSYSKIHLHEKFNYAEGKNDIATFIFKEEIEIDDHVKTIPLVGSHQQIFKQEATVMGWGFTVPDYSASSLRHLRYVKVPVLPVTECSFTVLNETICLETNGKGPCDGDSGGAVVVTISGVEVQIGVTTYGEYGCAKERSVATDIRGYNQWIIDHSDSKPNFI